MAGWRSRAAVLLTGILLAAPALPASSGSDWDSMLSERISGIDRETPGNLGVYVKHLGDGRTLNHSADRHWYLSSTTKVPVAIALLQQVEEGLVSLDETLILQESDYVDGAGDLLWQEPGGHFTLRTLLEKMLTDSDSTATDMLIRMMGEDELNHRVRTRMVPDGFEPLTTILQVRYDAYAELHPSVAGLSNMDFVRLKVASPGQERLQALVDQLPVGLHELQAESIEEAFERYYQRNLNSSTLEAFGLLLERLVRGELLSEAHTDLVLGLMENISTGDHRIKAGLPQDTPFAQKTGTQVQRACNVGVIHPRSDQAEDAVVVAACVEGYDNISDAEQIFQQVGTSIGDL